MSTFKETQIGGGAVERLLKTEDRLATLAAHFGQTFRRSQPRILAHLQSLSALALENIEHSMNLLLRSFEVCQELGADPWNDREFFEISMRESGVVYPKDFLDKIKPDDVIEGYDMKRRQFFRNMRFMEGTSYSLTEVLSYDWTVLFERPRHITEAIVKATERDMWSENRVIESDIPPHFIRELLSGKPQACQIRHRYFAPLYTGPNRPGGILSVCQGEVIETKLNVQMESLAFL